MKTHIILTRWSPKDPRNERAGTPLLVRIDSILFARPSMTRAAPGEPPETFPFTEVEVAGVPTGAFRETIDQIAALIDEAQR